MLVTTGAARLSLSLYRLTLQKYRHLCNSGRQSDRTGAGKTWRLPSAARKFDRQTHLNRGEGGETT
jgi:hypothetical protein